MSSIWSKVCSAVCSKSTGLVACGVLIGTAGVKVLASDDAKKVYTNCTAAVLRAKDCVLKTAATIQENAEDIYADAKEINKERKAAKEEDCFADEEEEILEDDFAEEELAEAEQ